MSQAQQLILLRNSNTLGINRGGIPGIYLETEQFANLTKPNAYGSRVTYINQTSINRKWLDCKTLDGARFKGKKYTMKELEKLIGKKIYIKNLPNRDNKPFLYYIKKLFGLTKKTKDTAFKYIYSVNQIRKQVGDFQVLDPWNNIPPIQYSCT